jgi:hypothetical protein
MKTIRNWTAVAALSLGLLAISTAPMAAEPVVGEQWTIGNFCVGVDLNFMRQFTNLVVRGGVPAYRSIITTKGSPCFDMRHNLADTVNVFLKEKLWGFTLPEGKKLVMWRVEDTKGIQGYTWMPLDREQNSSI